MCNACRLPCSNVHRFVPSGVYAGGGRGREVSVWCDFGSRSTRFVPHRVLRVTASVRPIMVVTNEDRETNVDIAERDFIGASLNAPPKGLASRACDAVGVLGGLSGFIP